MKFSEMPYTRVDMEKVEKKYAELTERLKAAKSADEQFEIHKDYYKFSDDVFTNIELAEVRNSIDTTDEFYEKEKEFYDENAPLIESLDIKYKKTLFESPFREGMEKHIGKVAFKNIEIAMKAFDDSIIDLMQEENALVTRYDKLLATAEIHFRGEVYNLSMMRPFMVNSDRATRKEACEAVEAYFSSVTSEIDEIYDKLVKNRTEQAKRLGYDTFTELGYYRMGRNCYSKDDVENFRRQVKESFMPLVNRIHEKRAARIGVTDGLKAYDNGVWFKEGNPNPTGTPQEILEMGRKMYHELSPETKEFFDFMMDNELFDVLSRKTKRQGGYMTYFPKYKSPFIFANFNGTEGDVDVITHECGHAFQGYLVGNNEIVKEYRDIGMETAEIHSMSMEYFTNPWMKYFFGDRADDFLTLQISDAIAFVPYGCMVDEFQHIVYANPEMTPTQRKEEWKKLEEIYRPHIDWGDSIMKSAYWQRQGHIFQVPFYYIDYVLASVCAMQYKVRMEKDYKATWQDYLKLCGMSAKDFYVNMLPQCGLEVPFRDGTVEHLVKALDKMV